MDSWDKVVATILLVDDEKIVRTLLAVALRRQDHTVIEASSGRRALRAVRKHGTPPDLLIAELALPRMSAIELALSLTETTPQIHALFLSRSPHPAKLEERATEAGHTVLREPFDFSTVVGKVAEMMDEPQTRKPPVRSKAADRTKGSVTGRR